MQWIEEDTFKFLGKQLRANASDDVARTVIRAQLDRGVSLIDALLLPSYPENVDIRCSADVQALMVTSHS